ncbi:hypothetical protein J1N35_005325 [Gossypium stocksii]|uniref:Uncharacterized protein n=1 Tax=Gossypium stocksii TaxID=47602 RepID=A0A9D4AJ56_9ROSI|nr:hypothetical protein J1N35_005325 [Gossypium stocksii]
MARVKPTSKGAQSSQAVATQPKTFFNTAATVKFNNNISSNHFASNKKNFTKPMPDFLDFLKVLLPFSKAEEEPVEIHSNKVEFMHMRATPNTVKATEEEPEKIKSLNIESDEDMQNEPTLAAKPTKKGKETFPPRPPQAMIAQNREIDCINNEITKSDKE